MPLPRKSSFRLPWMQSLPWAISLLLHVVIMAVAVFFTWNTLQPSTAPAPPAGEIRLSAPRTLPPRLPPVSPPPSAPPPAARALAASPAPAAPLSPSPPSPPAHLPAGAQATHQPSTTFLGAQVRGQRLVYVIDASGSLLPTMPLVLSHLQQSLARLQDDQQFALLFYQGDRLISYPAAGFARADVPGKQAARAWLKQNNIAPQGSTQPLPALQQALSLQPDAIFLLSDDITGRGPYEISQAALLRDIRQLNPRSIPIHTLQFLNRDPLENQGLRPTLELLGAQNQGSYRFVSAQELGLASPHP